MTKPPPPPVAYVSGAKRKRKLNDQQRAELNVYAKSNAGYYALDGTRHETLHALVEYGYQYFWKQRNVKNPPKVPCQLL